MVGNGSSGQGQHLSVVEANVSLQTIEEEFSGLVALVVGQGTEEEKERQLPHKISPTLVDLGYIPPDYLFKVRHRPSDSDLIRFNKDQRYLLEWAKRACDYANPPTPENVKLFLSTLGQISREAVRLGLEKSAGFQLGDPYIPVAIKEKVVVQGLWMIRKAVTTPSLLGDLEIQINRQTALIEAVAEIFGGTVMRLAQDELYKTVDQLRNAFVRGDNLLGLRGLGVDDVRTTYERLTAQLGDQLPFKRLPQRTGG